MHGTDPDSEGLALPVDDLLRPGARLIHIGPHKTGTTALQGAFHTNRDALAAHHVIYGSLDRQPMRAALDVTRRKAMLGEPTPSEGDWDRFAARVAAHGDARVVISSEFLADGDDAAAARVVETIGGAHPHVVVTLRPLANILPSQWQQYVQNGMRTSYDGWLDGMFRKPPYTNPTKTFWQRHRHDVLVARWAKVVGTENLTVVVVDDRDRLGLLHAFEDLLGLPHGVLVLEEGIANRSLTFGEVELVRALNVVFKGREYPESWYARYVRYGAVPGMKARRPAKDESAITTPTWALDRAAEIGAEMGRAIGDLGVNVVGDLALLGRRPSGRERPDVVKGLCDVPPAAAAAAVVGTLLVTEEPPPTTPVRLRRVADVTARELADVLVARARRNVGRRVRAVRSRRGPGAGR